MSNDWNIELHITKNNKKVSRSKGTSLGLAFLTQGERNMSGQVVNHSHICCSDELLLKECFCDAAR